MTLSYPASYETIALQIIYNEDQFHITQKLPKV